MRLLIQLQFSQCKNIPRSLKNIFKEFSFIREETIFVFDKIVIKSLN